MTPSMALLTIRLLAAAPAAVVVQHGAFVTLADGSIWEGGRLLSPPRAYRSVALRDALLTALAPQLGQPAEALIALANGEVPSDTPARCSDCGHPVPCPCRGWR